jgi:hypothetical protein
MVSWRGLHQALRRGLTAAVGELYAVLVSAFRWWCGPYSVSSSQDARAAPFAANLHPRYIQHRLGKNAWLTQTAQFRELSWLYAEREYSYPKSESIWNPVGVQHLAVGIASKVGQTAKARSGYRVQSLR